MKNWSIKKLGEVADITGGYAFKSSNLKDSRISDDYLPIIKIGNLDTSGTLNLETMQYHKFSQDLSKFIIREKDILIAMTGATVGKVAISNEGNLLLNQRVGVVRSKKDVTDQDYLKYFLLSNSFYKYCQITAGGGAQGNISPSQIMNFTVPLPSFPVQKKIVERLDAIRKTQELCDQQISKTEELFESLLIEEIEQKKDKWSIRKLPEVALVQRGKFTPRPRNDPRYFGGEIPWIQTGDITNSQGFISNYSDTLNDEGLKVSRLFPKGTIVITIAANIGDCAILAIDAAFPDSVVGVSTNENIINNKFLYLQLLLLKEYLNNQATQAAQKNINLQILSNVDIFLPPVLQQQKIVEKLSAVQEYKKLLFKQKELYKELFESALEKFMRGDLN